MKAFPLSRTNKLQQSDSGVYLSNCETIDYSEGSEAEAYLRRIFLESDDLTSYSVELESSIRDWSSEYHLTTTRANILRFLNLKGVNNGLELGCGCGSITRYLGELGIQVDAIEGGAARAELARLRCRDLDNVEIVQANFQELELPAQSYDAVFMIGVIEYASMFSPENKDDRAAIADIFRRIRSTLKPGGLLVLALENRMGLKYFFGAGEDHLAQPYVGIYDYPGKLGVRSYSRREWKQILNDNGWNNYSFSFPFPDYKLPRTILAEEFVNHDPCAHSLLYRIESRDYLSSWTPFADEFLSWKGVHRAGLLPELANSFLIVASSEKSSVSQCVENDFVHFSAPGRQPAYRTVTSKAVGASIVEKKNIGSQETAGNDLKQHLGSTPFHSGELLITSWIESLVSQSPFDTFTPYLREYHSFLIQNFSKNDNSSHLIELLPSNIIVDSQTGSWKTFDLEWLTPVPITIEYVFFRAVFWFAMHNRKMIPLTCTNNTMVTVEDFVSLCCSEVGIEYELNCLAFIQNEELLHSNVTSGMGKEIDVSYMLALPLHEIDTTDSMEAASVKKEPKVTRDRVFSLRKYAKRAAKIIQGYLFNHHYRIIGKSGIFDKNYYCSKDSALQDPSVEPLLHYVTSGFKEGRDPSPLFSLHHYMQLYPHLKNEEKDPLLHYLKIGWQEGAKTHPLLIDYLLNPGSVFKKPELVERIKKVNQKNLSYFDSDFYCKKYLDVRTSDFVPVIHYLYHGGVERRQPGPFFNPEWYVDRTPFFALEKGDLLDHYLKTGAAVGKSPVPVFDPEYYSKQIKESSSTHPDVFGHYLEYGIHEDQKPCSWFDPAFYRLSCSDFLPYSYPFDHYLYKGVHEKKYVNEKIAKLPHKPLISVIVPVYNVKKSYLNCCIRSVLFQSYPHWELCLVDDGSSDQHIQPQLTEWEKTDERIKVKYLDKNQGIAKASNAAAEMSTGQFLTFLDNDDELHPQALFYMVKRICSTGADLLYSDEDLIGDDGRRLSVFFKPGFNRELLLSHNYVTHMVLTSRNLFSSVGGFSPSLSGAQDYDLFLKLSEKAKKIEHVSKVLYHWRASESSTSINHGKKEYADEAGRNALLAMLERNEIEGSVLPTEWKFYYRVKRKGSDSLTISVLIIACWDDRFVQWLENLMLFSTYPDLQFIICCEKEQIDFLRKGLEHNECYHKIQLLTVQSVKEPARCYNKAAGSSGSQHVVFLNPFVKIGNNDWLEALLEYSIDPCCGLVGGKISKSREIENLTVPDLSQTSPAYYAKFIQKCSIHMNGLQCAQNISMVSCDLAMIKKDTFLAVGGFDETTCSHLYTDSDLSLRLIAKGYQNIYTPYATGELIAVEGEETKRDSQNGYQVERQLFQKRWQKNLVRGDLYYNIGIVKEKGIGKEEYLEWYSGRSCVKKNRN
ncbi:MAG: glycosyltransferase [Bacteroidetes bacterium]|nr:glycosyltransferase [Bacteroidota bacterium]